MSIIGHQQQYYEHLQQDLGEHYKLHMLQRYKGIHQEANICKVNLFDIAPH